MKSSLLILSLLVAVGSGYPQKNGGGHAPPAGGGNKGGSTQQHVPPRAEPRPAQQNPRPVQQAAPRPAPPSEPHIAQQAAPRPPPHSEPHVAQAPTPRPPPHSEPHVAQAPTPRSSPHSEPPRNAQQPAPRPPPRSESHNAQPPRTITIDNPRSTQHSSPPVQQAPPQQQGSSAPRGGGGISNPLSGGSSSPRGGGGLSNPLSGGSSSPRGGGGLSNPPSGSSSGPRGGSSPPSGGQSNPLSGLLGGNSGSKPAGGSNSGLGGLLGGGQSSNPRPGSGSNSGQGGSSNSGLGGLFGGGQNSNPLGGIFGTGQSSNPSNNGNNGNNGNSGGGLFGGLLGSGNNGGQQSSAAPAWGLGNPRDNPRDSSRGGQQTPPPRPQSPRTTQSQSTVWGSNPNGGNIGQPRPTLGQSSQGQTSRGSPNGPAKITTINGRPPPPGSSQPPRTVYTTIQGSPRPPPNNNNPTGPRPPVSSPAPPRSSQPPWPVPPTAPKSVTASIGKPTGGQGPQPSPVPPKSSQPPWSVPPPAPSKSSQPPWSVLPPAPPKGGPGVTSYTQPSPPKGGPGITARPTQPSLPKGGPGVSSRPSPPPYNTPPSKPWQTGDRGDPNHGNQPWRGNGNKGNPWEGSGGRDDCRCEVYNCPKRGGDACYCRRAAALECQAKHSRGSCGGRTPFVEDCSSWNNVPIDNGHGWGYNPNAGWVPPPPPIIYTITSTWAFYPSLGITINGPQTTQSVVYITTAPLWAPYDDSNPYSYPGYPLATYYPEPPPPPPPYNEPIYITYTTTQEATTVYVYDDDETTTQTVTETLVVTTETILQPVTVTATETGPEWGTIPTDPAPASPGWGSQQDPGQTQAPAWPNDPNQPQQSAWPTDQQPADLPPVTMTTTVYEETPFTPGAEPPAETDPAPIFDPGLLPSSAPVAIPADMQAPSKCGPNMPACAEPGYCDPQPLCALGQTCPGLCLPKLAGQYQQPEELRKAVWDKAMKDGVYRIKVVVTEVRTPVMTSAAFYERVVVGGRNGTVANANGTVVTSLKEEVRWSNGTGNSTLVSTKR